VLFDEVVVMDKGFLIYTGPVTDVIEHFESLGYVKEKKKDTADWLQELATPEGEAFLAPDRSADTPRSAEEFKDCFEKCDLGQKRLHEMEREISPHWIEEQQKEFINPYCRSLSLLMVRENMLVWRNKSFVGARIGQAVVLGLLVGTLFWDLDVTDFQTRMSLFFFTLMANVVGSMAMIADRLNSRAVFYKQRQAGFFPTSAYVFSNVFAQVPLNIIENIVMSSLIYWMCGLTDSDNGQHFIIFIFTIFIAGQTASALFGMLTYISVSVSDAQPKCGVNLILMVLFSGFVANQEAIPDYWTWFFWYNPMAWALRALCVNEFQSSEYQDMQVNVTPPPGTPVYVSVGNIALRAYAMIDGDDYKNPNAAYAEIWIYYGWLVMFGEFLFFNFLTVLILEYIQYEQGATVGVADPDEINIDNKDGAAVMAVGAKAKVSLHASRNAVVDAQENKHSEDILPAPPAEMVFQDLNYIVNDHQLLNHVTGYFCPGEMTALMGSSGAGKTTLMDCLALRKTSGEVTGTITINGQSQEPVSFSHLSGYVEQFDVQSPHSTVAEALHFSAKLRLDAHKIESERRHRWVDWVIETLELDDIAGKLIGNDQEGGLSFEQRKRLAIGIELVANPSILFLDEPTSGLDARAAAVVCRGLARIAHQGRTIVATIHQPSKYIFGMFDNLLLLKRGGFTVFFGQIGEEGMDIVGYLSSIPGTVDFEEGMNPATWMLGCIGAGTAVKADLRDYAVEYQRSELSAFATNHAKELAENCEYSTIEHIPKYEKGYKYQFWAVTRKHFLNYFRSPNYNLSRCMLSIVIAVIFGSVFANNTDLEDEVDVISRVAVMFITTVFIGVINLMSCLTVICTERDVFYRDQKSNMYTPVAFEVATFLAEIPYMFVATLLFCVPFYFILQYSAEAEKFFYYALFFFLNLAVMTFFGHFAVIFTPNQETAQIVASIFVSISNLFSGFLIKKGAMPIFWQFLYYVCPMHYALEGLIMSQFGDDDTQVAAIQGGVWDQSLRAAGCATPICKGSVSSYLTFFTDGDFKTSNINWNILILFAMIAALRCSTILGLYFVNWLVK